MKTLKSGVLGVAALILFGIMSACVQLGAEEEPVNNNPVQGVVDAFTQCSTPRPEICYELYQPVCATRDTGVRCVTTPCPSTEKVTYSNDCKACADQKVLGFQNGDCSGVVNSFRSKLGDALLNG